MQVRSLLARGVCGLQAGLRGLLNPAARRFSWRAHPPGGRAFKLGPAARTCLGATWLAAAPHQAFAARALSASAGSDIIAQLQFKQMGLLSWLLVDLAINWGGWAVASILKSEKFYDALGSVSFLTLSIGSLLATSEQHPRKAVLTAMVAAWTIRLGGFLIMRVMKTGGDSRFDEAKHQPATFFVYWTMQAVWVFTTALPLLLLNTSSGGGPRAVVWTDVLGVALWGTGLLLEATADWQKWRFKSDPANRGRFIDTGLWAYARFPNYFGEMLVWWGVFCTATAGLQGAQFASVVSPVFVMLLLRFVSGIPIQEKQSQARWGATPEYQAYVARTNLLIPVPKPGHKYSS